MLPTVPFGGARLSKLLLGSNPFGGFSHQGSERDEEMMDYYTSAKLKAAWDEAQKNGINGMCARGDRWTLRLMREHVNEGRLRMHWIAQTVPEYGSVEWNIDTMASFKKRPLGIYQHGGQVDRLVTDGEAQVVRERLKRVRDKGVMVGLATHQPEILARAADEDWDVDFFLACFYNLTGRGKKGLTAIAGSDGEKFHRDDPARMCEVIRQVSKPCVGFKVLGAGRRAKTREDLRDAFAFALENVKPDDPILVGVFQKEGNQIAENAALVAELWKERPEHA